MTGEFEGKVILVTGGSRGIGRAIAIKFAEEGAKVAVNYNKSVEKAYELKERYPNIEVFKADVSIRDEVRGMIKGIHDKLGAIDILVNNAGVLDFRSFEDYDDKAVRYMMDVNLYGVIYTTLEALDDLKRNRGVIINIASNAGIGTAFEGTTYYAVSKAGVIMLTKRLAYELGKYGIRVNAVAPGWVETDMTIGGKTLDEIKTIEEVIKGKTMLNMVGKPEYIADIVLFLASEKSRFITGQVIVADGGRIDNLIHSV